MTLRISAFLFLAVFAAGCTWEGRPDGAAANHTTLDGYYDDDGVTVAGPEFGTQAEVIEPLDGESFPAAANEAPVDLTQPAPTTGTADATSEVEEALTPGTEQ